MQDVYTQRTINLMVDCKFDQYINLMAKYEASPEKKITLLLTKIKEYEEEAKQEIMKEAMDRKADQERRNAK